MNACFIKFLKETLAALGNLPLQEASQVADLVDDQDEEPFSDEGCRREVKARCLDPTPWMLLVDVIRISLSLSLSIMLHAVEVESVLTVLSARLHMHGIGENIFVPQRTPIESECMPKDILSMR